jgi:hypothetical protein
LLEAFQWIAQEIISGGGDVTVSRAEFIQGLADNDLVELFNSARQADDQELIAEAKQLLEGFRQKRDDGVESGIDQQLLRLRRRFVEIRAIDYFDSPSAQPADAALETLERAISSSESVEPIAEASPTFDLRNRVWVTRRDIFVDRMASAWLILRFIDPAAQFKFVDEAGYSPQPGELRFDMFAGEFTHRGDSCTFEVLAEGIKNEDSAVGDLARIVHDIDLRDGKYGSAEAAGVEALLKGITVLAQEDSERLTLALALFDQLYESLRLTNTQTRRHRRLK